jgi:hypothetical protein
VLLSCGPDEIFAVYFFLTFLSIFSTSYPYFDSKQSAKCHAVNHLFLPPILLRSLAVSFVLVPQCLALSVPVPLLPLLLYRTRMRQSPQRSRSPPPRRRSSRRRTSLPPPLLSRRSPQRSQSPPRRRRTSHTRNPRINSCCVSCN